MAIDPICGMTIDPATFCRKTRAQRTNLLLLQPTLLGEIQQRPGDREGSRRLSCRAVRKTNPLPIRSAA